MIGGLLVTLVAACLQGDTHRPGAGIRCTEDGDCGDGDVCRYGRCRTVCFFDGDCPDGGRCVSLGQESVCTPSGVDEPSEHGEPCLDQTECADGHLCVDIVETAVSVCAAACDTDADCPEGERTSICVSLEARPDEWFCTVACDPESGDGCPEGVHCLTVPRWSDPPHVVATCSHRAGSGAQGASCAGEEDCAPGYLCGTEACERTCIWDPEVGAPCPEPTRCHAFDPVVLFEMESLGSCQ